jgi:hypothetical protein
MKTELIQALSNLNINSDSAEIVASEYISYLYFTKILDNVCLLSVFFLIGLPLYYLVKFLVKHCE